MSNPGDNGSWNPQGNDFDAQSAGHDAAAQPGQDPWAQPPAPQDPYGQQGAGQSSFGQDPYAQGAAGQPAQDPWAQPPASTNPYGQASGASASDPYGQASGASASDPYGQASGASASDPYGQGQQNWSAAPGSGPSASEPYGQAPAAGPAPQGQAQSRLLVGLMGIFFGGFGVHRFLMGYTTIGLVQVLLSVLSCFTLYPFIQIWGLIEGIMVLAKSPSFERDAQGRPLTD